MLNRAYQKLQEIELAQASRVAAILIAIIACLAIAKALMSVFETLQFTPDVPAPSQTIEKNTSYDGNDIAQRNLFGLPPVSGAADQANLPTTRLQLQLRGAFTSSTPKLASAIIQGPDGESRSYKAGSKVYGQATLHEVYKDRVVLERNGQLETLFFPENNDDSTSNTLVSSQINSRSLSSYGISDEDRSLVQDNMSIQEIKQAAKELGSAALTPEQRQQLIRQRLQDLRNRAKAKK